MKGTVFDIIPIIIVFLVLTIFLSMVYLFGTRVSDSMASQGINVTEMEKANMSNALFLNSLPFVVIMLGLVSVILAWRTSATPILIPITLLVLAINIIISAMISNILYSYATNTWMIPIFNDFPLLVWTIQYLPYIMGVMGLIIIFVQYSRVGKNELIT